MELLADVGGGGFRVDIEAVRHELDLIAAVALVRILFLAAEAVPDALVVGRIPVVDLAPEPGKTIRRALPWSRLFPLPWHAAV